MSVTVDSKKRVRLALVKPGEEYTEEQPRPGLILLRLQKPTKGNPLAPWCLTPGTSSVPLRRLTMTRFDRGDVVVVDLGTTGKIRPCVVVSIPRADSQRSMSVVVPMTTQIRGGECEVAFPKPRWLSAESVVNVLGIAGVDNAQVVRRLAPFPKTEFD